MAMTHTEMVDRIEEILHDSSNAIWSASLIGAGITEVLKEISRYVPVLIKETLTTTDGERTLDVSTLVDVIDIVEVEYKVDKDPRQLRNIIWIDLNTIRLDIAFDCDGGSAYLFCKKGHRLDADWVASTVYSLTNMVAPTTKNAYHYECTTAGTSHSSEPTWPTTVGDTVSDGSVTWTCRNVPSNSLKYGRVDLEDLFARLVAARLAEAKGVDNINKVNVGGKGVMRDYAGWAGLTLGQVMADLKKLRPPNQKVWLPDT